MATIQEIKKQIQLNGNIRNAAWVIRQFEKGRIKLQLGQFSEQSDFINRTTFDHFKSCIRVINEIYENNWDIDFELLQDTETKKISILIKGIFILFPEITINNRNGKSHNIKDLIVRIKIFVSKRGEEEQLIIGNIDGGRLYLTYAEYQSSYFHSHLPLSKSSIFSHSELPILGNFCTGSGEINMYKADLNGDGFTEERFMRFALQIMSLVSYESIEGTPYRRLEEISIRPYTGNMFIVSESKKQLLKRKVLSYYKSTNIIPKIDIIIDSLNNYSIVNNESFQKFLFNINYTEEDKRSLFCTPNENNTVYYNYGATSEYSNPPIIYNKFIFRGEEKSFVIEPAPNTTEIINYIIHPDLVNYLKKEIEYELNKNKIRQSTIDRYKVKSDNATESIQSNPVPVSTNS